jgi:spore maturation protein CgeB
MSDRHRIVILGLTITSSWGNGHATTYRGLVRELARRKHDVLFLERDVPWYAPHRDLARPPYGRTLLYSTLDELKDRFAREIRQADVVIVGSYVPDGIAVGEWVCATARGVTAFYDIDTPVTLARLDGGLEYMSAAMIPRFDLYLSFSGGPVPGIIEDNWGSPLAGALYCSADPEFYRPQPVRQQWSLGYLGTYSDDRQPSLERLLLASAGVLADHRFVVAGSSYPDHLKWPQNVERIEHLPQHEHPNFYSAQRFTLNVTRADMRELGFSPSVRLFEAAACGTPLISDRWPGIETIFEPVSEILLASNTREVTQILEHLPEDRRLSIADRARRRILAEHTPDHRAGQLEAYYLEAAARRRRKLRPATRRTMQVAEM